MDEVKVDKQNRIVRVRAFDWRGNDVESVTRCAICGTVLDPNEVTCPRCEQDAPRPENILTPTQVARAKTYSNGNADGTSRGAPNKRDSVIRLMVEANMIAAGQDVFRLGRYTDEFKRQFETARRQVAEATHERRTRWTHEKR